MGYTTDFHGSVTISPRIKPEHREYINAFSETRRMRRDPAIAEREPDPKRLAVGLPIGEEGGYFVGGDGFMGQSVRGGVLDYNNPPNGQPELWCKWWVDDSGELQWNGCEKFYGYVEWMEYLIDHFFSPWGYRLNGEIAWMGEDSNDSGTIYVKDNMVEAVEDTITNAGQSWGSIS